MTVAIAIAIANAIAAAIAIATAVAVSRRYLFASTPTIAIAKDFGLRLIVEINR